MDTLNLGIIGCGIAAKELHWSVLKQMTEKFRIAVACNRTERKAAEYAELVGGCPITTDYRDVLADDSIDAVCIALPFHLNLEVTEAALKAGKHVIVEKPLATDIADARRMVELENEYPGLVTLVAENMRYRRLLGRAKELIDTGEIGKPYSVIWNNFFFVNPESNKYAHTPWRMEEQYPGGFIVDAGVHNIAVLRTLFGEIENTRSQITGVTPALGIYDTFGMQFSIGDGIMGSLNLYFSAMGLNANMLHIFGDKGSLLIDRESITIKREDSEDIIEDHTDDMGYLAEFENFHVAITSGEKVVSSFEEGYKDFEVIMNGVSSAIERI